MCLNTVKLSTSPKAEHSTSQSCFPVLNWFYECEHRFVNKAMVIAEPTVPSVRLLGLGSRLYPSNMPRMRNKDRTRFKQRLSRRATIEQVNARRCSQSDVVHAIFFFSGRNDQRTGIHEI